MTQCVTMICKLTATALVSFGFFFGANMTSLVAQSPSTAEFFRVADSDARAKQLPADELYPRGRRMPLSLFSLPHENLPAAKKCGFTMAGPYYGKDQLKDMQAANAEGLKCFFPIGGHRDDVGLPLKGDQNPLSVDELKARVKSQMETVLSDRAKNAQVAIWYLTPEELRPWNKAEMTHLKTVAETARELDPLKRPVWMYEPNHRTATELAQTGEFLDMIGKGCYVNTGAGNIVAKRPIPHVWIRWSVEQEIEAVKQLAAKRGDDATAPTPIVALEMSQDPEDVREFEKIPDWIRHDVYLSLVCGAKGITIWSGAKRKGFEKTRDTHLGAYFQTVKEITTKHHLDQVFLFGEQRSEFQVQVIDGPAKLQLHLDQGKGKDILKLDYPSVAFLDAAYDGSRYLILVNSGEQSVKVRISGLPAEKIKARDVLGGIDAVIGSGAFTIPIDSLGVRVFRFDP